VYSVVGAVHEFDFRLVKNETYDKWRPVERSCSDYTLVLDWIYSFPLTVFVIVKRIYSSVADRMYFLRKRP
jgi:hypothetical protein